MQILFESAVLKGPLGAQVKPFFLPLLLHFPPPCDMASDHAPPVEVPNPPPDDQDEDGGEEEEATTDEALEDEETAESSSHEADPHYNFRMMPDAERPLD